MDVSDIDNKIREHMNKSLDLKRNYLGNDKLSYEKSKELQKQQSEEYNKMLFFKNLKREMQKDGNNIKN